MFFLFRFILVEGSAVGSAEDTELCAAVEGVEHLLLVLVLDGKNIVFGQGIALMHRNFGCASKEGFSQFLGDDLGTRLAIADGSETLLSDVVLH